MLSQAVLQGVPQFSRVLVAVPASRHCNANSKWPFLPFSHAPLQLLASPLSRQRLAHLHTLLDACCFMVLPFTPASLLSDQPGSTAQACSATLNFLQVLCILVPVALLVWTQSPAEQSGSAEQSEQRQQELHQQLENTGQVPEQCGWPAGLAAVLRRASSGADSLLRWTFLVQGGWVQRAVHLMVLFDGVWLAMKVSS